MISFIQEIPKLNALFSQKRTKCLLFNYDVLTRLPDINDNHLRQITDLSNPPDIFTGFISNHSFKNIVLPHKHSLILAGHNGVEINGPGFLWNFPHLGLIQHQLDRIVKTLSMEISPEWSRNNVRRNGLALTLSISTGGQVTTGRVLNLVQAGLSDTLLVAKLYSEKIEILPAERWDRQLFIQKIIDLLPNENGLAPTMYYFGSSTADETAFKETNLHGYSILLKSNIGRRTCAQYYLKTSRELNKILIWFSSQT